MYDALQSDGTFTAGGVLEFQRTGSATWDGTAKRFSSTVSDSLRGEWYTSGTPIGVKPGESNLLATMYVAKGAGIQYTGNISYTSGGGQLIPVAIPLSDPLDSPPTIILGSAVNSTIITGGTGTLGATVASATEPPYASPLNYTVSAAVQSGAATLGSVSPGSGSLGIGESAAHTVSAVSTNIGQNLVRFTASSGWASNSPQTIDATLTVLGNSAAAFANGSGVLNLNFGTLQVGTGTHGLQFQIKNLLADYRAKLDLDSVVESSDAGGVFSTDAAPFSNLPSGNLSSFFDVSLDTANLGNFSGQYQFNLSDQKNLDGHAGAQTLTLNVTGNVVPEPSTLVLLGVAAIGVLAWAWRPRRT